MSATADDHTTDHAPDYATQLAAYHRAFRPELEAMLQKVPLARSDRALDVACGDGFYSDLLAGRCGRSAQVVAVDIDHDWLRSTRERNAQRGANIVSVMSDVECLPFSDDSFDFVWCAQSFYSLPKPIASLREMRRVTRPGGCVAVLENDTLHHVLLPWPVELELAVRKAELEAFGDETRRPRKYYIGRALNEQFQRAGFAHFSKHSWATTRQHPLPADEFEFLRLYLLELRDRVGDRIAAPLREEFDRWTDADADDSPIRSSSFVFTCIDHVVWALKQSDGE